MLSTDVRDPTRPDAGAMTTRTVTRSVDPTRLARLSDQVFADFAAAMTLPLVRLGDRWGLYRRLAAHGPVTSEELASRCGLPEQIVHEWLAGQAAAGYVTCSDSDRGEFTMSPEQVALFVDEDSGANMLAAFQLAAAYTRSEPGVAAAIASRGSCSWGEHDDELFEAVERFYRPAYSASLVQEWIPSLEHIEDILRTGARVADVGCGHGLSTVLMAAAFPESTFLGIDDHASSIERARELAGRHGVADRVTFEVGSAIDLQGTFDLVVLLDSFHDMGDPVDVATQLRQRLSQSGAAMVVEPFAADRLADNLTPLGRAYYAASTLACTPSALSQSASRPLGAQAGPARLVAALETGGFKHVRVCATTAFNLVLDARP